tara:strand:- start:332 stop:1120 length:789 start_codon:yes stop_codon:yes gene_type:complete
MIESKFIKYIKSKIKVLPDIAIILGSGLGGFTKYLQNKIIISYNEIENYPKSTVKGHNGEFIFGFYENISIICASGRFHYYEGHTLNTIRMPIRLIKSLKCNNIIITGAAGCLNKDWILGDLMLIKGYIDYSYLKSNTKPKIVKIFNKNNVFFSKIKKDLQKNKISIKEGIYTWTIGPSYETLAEINDIIRIGGDAVGMSTVPEIIESIKLEMNVLGVACLTNYGAGLTSTKPSHKEVLLQSKKSIHNFTKLLLTIIENYEK